MSRCPFGFTAEEEGSEPEDIDVGPCGPPEEADTEGDGANNEAKDKKKKKTKKEGKTVSLFSSPPGQSASLRIGLTINQPLNIEVPA